MINLLLLQEKIRNSHLLSEAEKAVWQNQLASLNEGQCIRLEKILDEAATLSWSPEMSTYIDTAALTTH